jgi:hypothetical protein
MFPFHNTSECGLQQECREKDGREERTIHRHLESRLISLIPPRIMYRVSEHKPPSASCTLWPWRDRFFTQLLSSNAVITFRAWTSLTHYRLFFSEFWSTKKTTYNALRIIFLYWHQRHYNLVARRLPASPNNFTYRSPVTTTTSPAEESRSNQTVRIP